MEGARLLSLRLLSLSKYRSKVVTLPRPSKEKYALLRPTTPYDGKALFEMPYLCNR